jgi:hypothetical protein
MHSLVWLTPVLFVWHACWKHMVSWWHCAVRVCLSKKKKTLVNLNSNSFCVLAQWWFAFAAKHSSSDSCFGHVLHVGAQSLSWLKHVVFQLHNRFSLESMSKGPPSLQRTRHTRLPFWVLQRHTQFLVFHPTCLFENPRLILMLP